MHVMTAAEVREFETKNAWATGIRMDEDGDLYYNMPEASCITLPYPETPLRVTYFARLISMLGTMGDEANFNGALLWIRYWNSGSSQLEKSGWRLVERMRMGFGELSQPRGVGHHEVCSSPSLALRHTLKQLLLSGRSCCRLANNICRTVGISQLNRYLLS